MKRPCPRPRPRTSAHAAAPLALAAGLGALALLTPAPARAQQGCSISSTALAFGAYDPFATTPLDSTSELIYRCPPGPRLRISLDAGGSGSFAARELRRGADVLRYNLYLDAARTVVWGDGAGGSATGPQVTVTGAGGTVTAYVFGRIPAGQDPVPGTYADTIRVTYDL
jgi:spore coat protein U-like protein